MKSKLSTKLGLTYLAIILIAMLAFGYFILRDWEQNLIQERKVALLSYANIVAEKASPYLREQETAYLNVVSQDFAESIGHRVLIFNTKQQVIADSADVFNNQNLRIPEVTAALNGESTWQAHYYPEYGRLLYLSVPIASGKQVLGAVFIAADINDLSERTNQLRNKLLLFALSSGILAFLLSLSLTRVITVPVDRLTTAAREMAHGVYGRQVDIKSQDELGLLANSFNEMSKKIKQEDETRRQFIANASHELKSPIAAIKALIESLLIKKPDSIDETLEWLKDVDKEMDRLGRLINDLLLLSSIEKNTSSLLLKDTPLLELLAEVKESITPLSALKGVTINILSSENIIWPMDREKIYRAMYNLLDNAVKYSPAEEMVTIQHSVTNGRLEIEITDKGPGILREHQDKIFERFYRVDKSRERATGGTGLGLAIVKEIINLHGGNIFVDSQPNLGSTFTISLPKI